MGGFLTGVDPGIRKTKTPTVNTFAAGVGFTAGSSTTISLTDAPGTEEHLTIFFDGVGQHRSTYSLSGSTVTFDTAIPTGVAEVEATYAPAVYAQLSTVSDNEITLAKMAGGTDGNIISYDASGNPVAIATGTDGQVLTSAGAGAQPAFEDAGGGKLLQVVNTIVSSTSTGTTVVPSDDTIMQNDEGDEYMTLAITPNNSSNKLVIHSLVNLAHTGSNQSLYAGLFQDTTANALMVANDHSNSGNRVLQVILHHYMAAGTTSSTTFKIRAGGQDGATTTFNGSGGSGYGGDKINSSMTIWENEA